MTKKIEVKVRRPATQTQRIRSAMKAYPDLTPKQIANIVGVNPRAVHMVKYLDKKRGTQKPDVANNTPKLVVEKKGSWSPATPSHSPAWIKRNGSWSPATPSHSPAWIKRNLSNEMDAVKQAVEEIKKRDPDHGKPMALWEIVVICVAVTFVVTLGMRLAGVN